MKNLNFILTSRFDLNSLSAQDTSPKKLQIVFYQFFIEYFRF